MALHNPTSVTPLILHPTNSTALAITSQSPGEEQLTANTGERATLERELEEGWGENVEKQKGRAMENQNGILKNDLLSLSLFIHSHPRVSPIHKRNGAKAIAGFHDNRLQLLDQSLSCRLQTILLSSKLEKETLKEKNTRVMRQKLQGAAFAKPIPKRESKSQPKQEKGKRKRSLIQWKATPTKLARKGGYSRATAKRKQKIAEEQPLQSVRREQQIFLLTEGRPTGIANGSALSYSQ